MDDDELKSAEALLRKYAANTASESSSDAQASSSLPNTGDLPKIYSVTPILIPQEDGITCIAFALDEILLQISGRICEISLDSACKSLQII